MNVDELINRPYSQGTTVTNCVAHSGQPITSRSDACRLCRTDVVNVLSRALRVNEFLNTWKDDATKALQEFVAELNAFAALMEMPDGPDGQPGGRARPENLKAYIAELQSEWDGAEKRAMQAETDRNAARVALKLVLPLAKGYAAENRLASNESYIREAENVLEMAGD